MSFSLFSVAILLATAGFIAYDAVRGARRGIQRTVFSLISILTSLVIALIFSPYIARNLGSFFTDFAADLLHFEKTEYMDMFISAMASMLLSSVLFLFIFVLCRVLLAMLYLIAKFIASHKKDKSPVKKPEKPMYVKNYKRVGASLGAICGLLVAVIAFAPLMGTLTLAKDAVTIIEKADKNILASDVGKELASIKKYAKDGPGLVLYHMGGKLIYASAASTTVSGENVYLVKELENAGVITEDFLALVKVLGAPYVITDEDMAKINLLSEHLNKSKLMSVLLAEYLPKASRAWLAGESFMNIKRPSLGTMNSAFDVMLSVCAESDLYSVNDNVGTLLKVCSILLESGILQAGSDVSAILQCIDESFLLEKLDAELAKNPNMEPVREYLSNIVMRIMAEQLFNSGKFTSEMLSELTVNLSSALTEIMEGEYENDEAKVEAMMSYAKDYIGKYDITLPDSIAEVVSTELLQRVGAGGEITSADIEAILMGFLGQ